MRKWSKCFVRKHCLLVSLPKSTPKFIKAADSKDNIASCVLFYDYLWCLDMSQYARWIFMEGDWSSRDHQERGLYRVRSLAMQRFFASRYKPTPHTEAEIMNVKSGWGFWASSWEFSDLRFLYGFLKPCGRGYCFLSVLAPFSFTETVRGCASLKKKNSQAKL